ncbi:MAG: low molecular weight protein arginine phosphatase [Clostridia bacterium]|nr:low molecular weight protein arginine phosphatase [Clostridia bacterium]
MNILFVCTGNTCRSPIAAYLFDRIASEEGLDVRIESAGLFASEGEGSTAEAIIAMKKYGVDMLSHHSQPINSELLQKSDLILAMTEAHKMLLAQYASEKTYTLSEFVGEDGDIPDPFGGDVTEYEECAEKLMKLLKKLAVKLKEEQNG